MATPVELEQPAFVRRDAEFFRNGGMRGERAILACRLIVTIVIAGTIVAA